MLLLLYWWCITAKSDIVFRVKHSLLQSRSLATYLQGGRLMPLECGAGGSSRSGEETCTS